MNKGGHLAIGFIVGVAFILITNKFLGWFQPELLNAAIIYPFIIALYCLLPDIDHKNSTVTWFAIGLAGFIMAGAYYLDHKMLMGFGIGLLIITFIAAQFFKHRGPTHTIWFGALISVPIYLMIGVPEGLLAFIAYYSHLAADGLWFKISF